MHYRFLKLPTGNSFCQIERCISVKWRQNIKPSNVSKRNKVKSHFSYESFEGSDNISVSSTVDCLVTTLKEFSTRGHLSDAFRSFSLIQGHALASSSSNFIVDSLSSLLFSCVNLKLLREGKQLHAKIITWGLHDDCTLVPKLVSLYAAFDLSDDAHFIVANVNTLSPVPWNILISSYVRKRCFKETIFTYKEMCYKRIRPDNFTYASVLKACAELSNLDFGREVHRSVNASSLNSNLFVQNALVSMYGKCGDLETARDIFNNMLVKDVVSWNSIISEYASRGIWDEVFELFDIMQAAGVEVNIITWNTVAGGYLRKGKFKGALELISQMGVVNHHLDHVTMIIGLGACSHLCALRQGKEIHALAIRNSCFNYENVKNSLITFYCRCGDLTHAYIVFRSMEAKSIVTWNSMISGISQWDRSEEAMFLFRILFLMSIEPNCATLACILSLCARVANLKHGKELHCYITRRGELHGYQLLWNALIDIYAKTGQVLVARRLFDILDKRDAVTYTSMIVGYGMHGDGFSALKLFEEMIRSNIKPDHVTMVAVLSACSHSGLVPEGQLLFERMQIVYHLTPLLEHFSCMVDLYARGGFLKKAREIILRMPYKPTADIWATLIVACRIHRNTDIGEWAADKLLELKPQHPGYYVLIENMYAATGCWNKVVTLRTFMIDLSVRKDPGYA